MLLTHAYRASNFLSLRATQTRRFTMATAEPTFKPFTLALVQLGQVGGDKAGASLIALVEVIWLISQ